MRKQREHEDLEQDEEIILVSRSEMKRDAHALRALGEKLAALKPGQLEKFPLQGRIIDALGESKRITSHNARKRHFGFIGKLLQEQDVDAIQQQLELLDSGSDEYNRQFHILERWRERLLNDGNEAVSGFVEAYPETDVQHLRQMVRNILKEKSEEKKAVQSKKLFRFLRETSGL